MSYRRLALALLALCLAPAAHAGTTVYGWNIVGSGYYSPDPLHGAFPPPFGATGFFSVAYDPERGFSNAALGLYGPQGGLLSWPNLFATVGTSSIGLQGLYVESLSAGIRGRPNSDTGGEFIFLPARELREDPG
jgi:hypothetical protein